MPLSFDRQLAEPHFDWLRRRWQLPEDAVPAIEKLLQSEFNGGTACLVSDPPNDWSAWHPAISLSTSSSPSSPILAHQTSDGWFLQSHALHRMEKTVAAKIRSLAKPAANPPTNLCDLLAALFPDTPPGSPQLEAAQLALTSSLAIITGGPGTGKTYTLARILAALTRQPGFQPNTIRLAAPTGKAAQRMKEAIAQAADSLPSGFPAATLRDIAASCSTLHTLLGYNPATGQCRDTPLPQGVTVILDEASMIDLPLWHALLERLPDDARLLILGDPCQLESVGQGAVLADLTEAPSLRSYHIRLTQSHRFKNCPGLQKLASAMLDGDTITASALLQAARPGPNPSSDILGLCWQPEIPIRPTEFPDSIRQIWKELAQAPSPEAALQALSRVCILTAHRETLAGALPLSRRIENYLLGLPDARFLPILIERNDPTTGLKNGMTGVLELTPSAASSSPNRQSQAHFLFGNECRSFPASMLPDHAPAGAITIHRAQGSEYDTVVVLIPPGESPLATRALLYTAITRARQQVIICGDLDDAATAIANRRSRCTLLRAYLEDLSSTEIL